MDEAWGGAALEAGELGASGAGERHGGEAAAGDSSAARADALWEGDTGTLELDARRALLQLVKGPSLEGSRQGELWRALMNNRAAIESRLADLFLELVVDDGSMTAFVRNVSADKADVPKAVKSQSLNVTGTVMALCLRRELLTCGYDRAIVSKDDVFDQLAPYRPLAALDEAAYARRLDSAWASLAKAGLLLRTDTEDRWEVSPVLKLVFDGDQARAVADSFEDMLAAGAAPSVEDVDGDAGGEGGAGGEDADEAGLSGIEGPEAPDEEV